MFSALKTLAGRGRAIVTDWWDPVVKTFLEITFAVVVSNLAILITVFVHWLITEKAEITVSLIFKVVRDNISPPEIIIYVLGFLAPALWIMLRHFRAWRNVPLYLCIAGGQAVVMVGSAIVFALFKADSIKNADAASTWAALSFFGSLVIWFVTSLYEKKYLSQTSTTAASRNQDTESGAQVMKGLEVPQ